MGYIIWILGILWAALSAMLMVDNLELLENISVWRSIVATVILILGAPVFFLSDILEVLLDFITEEE